MSRKTPYHPLGGGLDLVTPIIQMRDGNAIGGLNYEPWINGGYRRIKGYERYDGQPAPSEATWVRLIVDSVSGYSVGDVVTGDTSTATGTIVAIDSDTFSLVLTKVTGTFEVEAIDTATTNVTEVQNEGADTVTQEAAWRLAAENEYRDDIAQVPGSGSIRGVWQVRDRVYAVRDNPGATAGIIHKATASGWDDSVMDYAHTVTFDTGTTEIEVGDTLDGASSTATGTVHKVIVHSGSWGGGDAAGYIALTGVTGTYTSGENLQVSAVTRAVATADSAEYALPVGGVYDFVSTNFLAGSDTYRVYAANGEGPAIEIDEDDVVTPILLDLTLGDAPTENNPYLVEEFNGQLWLGFPGGSLQRSVTGSPLQFNGFLGAAEYGLGEEITGLVSSAGRVLIAFTRREVHAFEPLDADPFYIKKKISDRAGCILRSEGELSTIYAIDDSGMIDLRRVEQFGDFADSTISDKVQPIFESNRENIAGVQMIRESNQYRVLFTNGDGIIVRLKSNGAAEFMPYDYNVNVNCVSWCEDEDTAPTYWMGGSGGYVYQCERGRNFDGETIESVLRLPFNHQGNPASRKRYRLAELELEAERDLTLLTSHDLSYAGSETGSASWTDTVLGGGGFYDRDNWDQIYWDAQTYTTARFELRGTGRNISILFYHDTATTAPFILQGLTLHFDQRRVGR